MSASVSFSAHAAYNILNSNWLNPSNYQERTLLSVTPETLADRKEKGWVHVAGKPFRAVARIACMAGIIGLVAPAGCIYHAYKLGELYGFSHRSPYETRKISEYTRALFLDLGFVALGIGLSLVPLSIIGIISLEFGAVGIPLGMIASLLSCPQGLSELLTKEKALAATLKNNFGCVASENALLTLSPYFSRNLVNPGTYAEVLDTIRKESANRLLDTISGFNKSQPWANAIPFHYPPDAGKIVSYLEVNKNSFGLPEAEFTKLVNNIKINGRLYLDSNDAYSNYSNPKPPFIYDEESVKKAFANNNGKLRQEHHKSIPSLSLWVFKKIHSSNLLYPSNAESQPLANKGSIKESVADRNELFDPKLKNPGWRVGKPVRALARAVIFAVGTALVSPVGVVWHGANSLWYTGKAIIWCKDPSSGQYWQKTGQHVKAFFTDLLVLSIIYGTSYFSVGIAAGLPSCTIGEAAGNIFGIIALNTLPLFAGFAPGHATPYLAWSNERTPLIKAMSFKNNFGITAPDGSLLEYDEVVDKEILEDNGNLKGHLPELLIAQAMDILYAIQELQSKLPEGTKLQYNLPLSQTFMDEVQEKGHINWLNRYKKLKDNYALIASLLKNCLEIQDRIIFENSKKEVTLPEFILSEQLIRQAFYCTLPSREDPWKKCIREARESVPNEGPVPNDEFKRIREAVIAGSSPWVLLGIPEGSSLSVIKRAWQKGLTAVSPDKVPSAYSKEAGALFNCVNYAYNLLKDQASEVSVESID